MLVVVEPLVVWVGIGAKRSFGCCPNPRATSLFVVGIGNNQLRRGASPGGAEIGVQTGRVAGLLMAANEGSNSVGRGRCGGER